MQMLFDCWHSNFTKPITTKEKGCYCVCLECGREFRYCMNRMAIQYQLPRVVTHQPDSHTGTLLEDLTKMVEERVR